MIGRIVRKCSTTCGTMPFSTSTSRASISTGIMPNTSCILRRFYLWRSDWCYWRSAWCCCRIDGRCCWRIRIIVIMVCRIMSQWTTTSSTISFSSSTPCATIATRIMPYTRSILGRFSSWCDRWSRWGIRYGSRWMVYFQLFSGFLFTVACFITTRSN